MIASVPSGARISPSPFSFFLSFEQPSWVHSSCWVTKLCWRDRCCCLKLKQSLLTKRRGGDIDTHLRNWSTTTINHHEQPEHADLHDHRGRLQGLQQGLVPAAGQIQGEHLARSHPSWNGAGTFNNMSNRVRLHYMTKPCDMRCMTVWSLITLN